MNRPAVDVMDESFVVAEPSEVAARFRDPALWQGWWPRLRIAVTEDRGDEGVRWSVDGELVGTAEIWLQPWGDGVRVHWMLRAEPARPGGPLGRRRIDPGRLTASYVTAYKSRLHALKDALEAGRAVGTPRPGDAGRERGSLARRERLAPQKAPPPSE
ncbi:hypothetical protein [Phytoactinopolyspora alkaliphila]|uniref:hypothetical protein n=1 Tax=Phytoactinopolyspora alkaliphila TaxID=1783498 RepID=UPI001C206E48|nr:hypothetical protein [Phytoactinopolyspora alkaliphila]